jgi:hypothetical protein
MKNLQHNLYVRRGGRVSGPYPFGLVSRYVLLGRIRFDDEVSSDRVEWFRVRELDALIPEVMREAAAHPEDPETIEKLESARRWADERRGAGASPAGAERRAEPASRGRQAVEPAVMVIRPRHYAILALIVAAVIALPFLLPAPDDGTLANCDAAPAPGVNWSNCLLPGRNLANLDLAGANLRSADLSTANLRAANLRGSDLAYVNFSLANLRGTNLADSNLLGASLRGADLINANLQGADLRYAILTDVHRSGADFTGARLDFAEWEPGVQCLADSVGTCRMP